MDMRSGMVSKSEKAKGMLTHFRKKSEKTGHKNLPMRILTRPQSTTDEIITDKNTPRAVYICSRSCIQTLRGFAVRYFNLCLRAVECHVPFCHWGLVVSSEFPTESISSGQTYELSKPWS